MVEVLVVKGHPTFGVISWIWYLPCVKDKLIRGLELVRKGIISFDILELTFSGCPKKESLFVLGVWCCHSDESKPSHQYVD